MILCECGAERADEVIDCPGCDVPAGHYQGRVRGEALGASGRAVCVCGHERRHHFGPDGTCIRGHRDGTASVCPCPAFRATT